MISYSYFLFKDSPGGQYFRQGAVLGENLPQIAFPINFCTDFIDSWVPDLYDWGLIFGANPSRLLPSGYHRGRVKAFGSDAQRVRRLATSNRPFILYKIKIFTNINPYATVSEYHLNLYSCFILIY